MDKMNVKILRVLIQEHGVKGLLTDLAQAFSQEADDLSDMGLKERAIEASDVAEVLSNYNHNVEDLRTR
jgi:hypothetical protein